MAPAFLHTMHATLTELAGGASVVSSDETAQDYQPVVSVRRSLSSKDHIISLIDGKPYKTLTRHLSTNGLTPAEYRQRYGLKADYPMVAESYSAHRRELAKSIGLGRRAAGANGAAKPKAKAAATRGRKPKAVESAETKLVE